MTNVIMTRARTAAAVKPFPAKSESERREETRMKLHGTCRNPLAKDETQKKTAQTQKKIKKVKIVAPTTDRELLNRAKELQSEVAALAERVDKFQTELRKHATTKTVKKATTKATDE